MEGWELEMEWESVTSSRYSSLVCILCDYPVMTCKRCTNQAFALSGTKILIKQVEYVIIAIVAHFLVRVVHEFELLYRSLVRHTLAVPTNLRLLLPHPQVDHLQYLNCSQHVRKFI